MASSDVSDELLGKLARRQYELFRRVREGSIPVDDALDELQELIEKKRDSYDRITVPQLSAAELFAWVKNECRMSFCDDAGYAAYDFVHDEGGKTFDVMRWKPHRSVHTEEVRAHFGALGFDGNAAAFVAWTTHRRAVLHNASIPSDDSRLYCDPSSGRLLAPCFINVENRTLGFQRPVEPLWRDHWCFVAFREVKNP